MKDIGVDLVQEVVAEQFPRWASLPLRPVEPPGWDNASFRLGDTMVVRFPRDAKYEPQVDKEERWLALLAPHLPLPIPETIAIGQPSKAYPWRWSIRRWIDGAVATVDRIDDRPRFARELATFLRALQVIPAEGGPAAGPQSFHRGGALSVYDDEAREALRRLSGEIDRNRALRIWDEAIATCWAGTPVWVHGDISAGNLLVRDGALAAVIDFGQLATGDPACDLAIAWTLLSGASRDAFRSAMGLDPGTWKRGKAWALWKALITASALGPASAIEAGQARRTLGEVLGD